MSAELLKLVNADNHVLDVQICWTFFKFAKITKCAHLMVIVKRKYQDKATSNAAAASELTSPAPVPVSAPTLAPFTSVLVVLRGAGETSEQAGAVPHVVAAISSFLDFALPEFWSLPRACEANLLSLLRRLAARGCLPLASAAANDGGGNGIDPFYWASQCSQGLVSAVTNDNLEMVEWLHELCPSVLPYTAMVEAARTENLRLLQWFASRHPRVPWIPQMMDAAASTGRVEVLQWLHDHLKNAGCNPTRAFGSAVRGGHLGAVTWFYEHYGELAKSLHRDTLTAIRSGHTDVTKFLLSIPEHSRLPLSTGVLVAAGEGNLALVQWLLSTCSRSSSTAVCFTSSYPIDFAARGGHLHVVQWLHQHQHQHHQHQHSASSECTHAAMDGAAGHGSLELVQWLHEHRTEECTSDAMDSAASGGHLEVVQWLHAHRSEGCATYATDVAATEGHLATLQWLHANRNEGCTTQAMDGAAKNGHLEIVTWLHEHRSEGCTVFAMDHAAGSGHLEIVQFLHANRSEGCTTGAMQLAAVNGHFAVLLFLHAHRSEGCTADTIRFSDTCVAHMEIVQWLSEKYPDAVDVAQITRRDYYMTAVLDHILWQTFVDDDG